jgi:hypothetical protein
VPRGSGGEHSREGLSGDRLHDSSMTPSESSRPTVELVIE